MKSRNALGKGLGALLSTPTGEEIEQDKSLLNKVALVPIAKLVPNPHQPRKDFDEGALEELKQSISVHGIIQPITVLEAREDKHLIISGERRYRAAKAVGLEEVPVYVRGANDQTLIEMALVENTQRKDLNAIEIALTYERLIEECKLTQEELAERVGKSRSAVTNYMRLLKLPYELQVALRNNELTMGHARALLGVDDQKMQIMLYNEIKSNGLSVREIEKIVQARAGQEDDKAEKKKPKAKAPNAYEHYESKLVSSFQRHVKIKGKRNGKGEIVIPFGSEKELQKLIDLLEDKQADA